MAKLLTIKKGLDIPLKGVASDKTENDVFTAIYAITPDDFPGYTWKALVKAGDRVSCGTPLLHAKECKEISLTSPVAGIIEDVHRGERRKIEYISVKKDGDQTQASFDATESVITRLRKSGLYSMMRQRPYDIVPDFNAKPRDIFVTAFDSAPLAPSLLDNCNNHFLEEGLQVLASLTDGKIYLSVPVGSGITSSAAEVYEIKGPHPAGNVGTQIANIKPVNKGETVWTLDVVTVCRIGEFIKTGKLDYSTKVALTGQCMKNPHMVDTVIGAKISSLLEGEISDESGKVRIISGNVLTGYKVNEADGFLRFPYRQIAAIPEGDNADEFMGWASMNPKKYSVNRTFPAFLRGLKKPFDFDARIKGGHRAMIMSGEYDKVFPFDIYPEYLLKAILSKDIEKMEERGIYEVAPEDFALPEFVDTSKLELQKIVREGLDYLRKETM